MSMPAHDHGSLPTTSARFVRPVMRVLRDLRLSAMLLGLTLLSTAAPAAARAPVCADDSETAGRTRDRDSVANAYVIHVPGIAGPMRFDRRFAQGLVIGGAGSEVEIFDWVGRRRGLAALWGVEENKRQSQLLAEHILELKRKDPQRALILTAHSGGTAIVAWALEMLPEMQAARQQAGEGANAEAEAADQRPGQADSRVSTAAPLVDGVILIASGLSPEYDLSPMLQQVSGRVFHLSSDHDSFILGAGTMLLGTLDRKNGVAAGKTGFYLPVGVAAQAYAKFAEVPYDVAWAELGHWGDHESMMTTSFAAKVMADLVRASAGVEAKLPTTRPAPPAPVPAKVVPATADEQATAAPEAEPAQTSQGGK